MNQLLVAEILSSDSDEIAELRANIPVLEGLIDLAQQIEALPDISRRFYEESRSLYQVTCTGQSIEDLENMLAVFFGPPVKAAGKSLPRKLKKNSSIRYLGGIQKDQSFFLLPLKTGEFYGALWPWQRNKAKIEIHLGYCSDWIADDDYDQIQTLVKRSLSKNAFEQMDTAVGGQIHGISLPSFLQMAEMERSSFTLRIMSENQVGRLFVSDGTLIAARTDDLAGRLAAYKIISWDNASIEIAPADDTKTDEIQQPLMHVLMESLKIKDELSVVGETPPTPAAKPKQKVRPRPKPQGHFEQQAPQLIRLERTPAPPPPRKKVRPMFVVAALSVFCILAAAIFVIPILLENARSAERAFEKLSAQLEETVAADQKLALLEKYLQTYPNTPFSHQVLEKIQDAHQALEDQSFEQITLQVSNLEVNDQYEKKAISLYADFLEKYPESRHAEQINQTIADIKDLLDQYYYEELKRAARLDFKDRMETYQRYVSHFPEGRYRQDVETLIEEMGKQYFAYLRAEAEQCDKNRRWESCVTRITAFIDIYKDAAIGEQAGRLKAELMDKRDVHDLRQTAEKAGNDFSKAYETYRAYLQKHPQTTQKAVIQGELKALEKNLDAQRKWTEIRNFASDAQNNIVKRIQRLDHYLRANMTSPFAADAQDLMNELEDTRQFVLRRQHLEDKKKEEVLRMQRERERLAQIQKRAQQIRREVESTLAGSARFRANGDGAVTDLSTGLTWNVLDSFQELGGCLSYDEAIKYAAGLTIGNHADWRLPTASELAALYKQEPFYPASGAQWYWSSESYVKGFHTVANVVTSKQETAYTRESRQLTECGAARAVRP